MSHQEHSDDLRIRRTRKMLRDALTELTTEKGFAAITVQDITDRAMVNRATFYRHYQDKYDLMVASIAEVLDELEVLNQPLPSDQANTSADEPLPAMTRLFEHVARHARFCRAMLGKNGTPFLAEQLQAYVERIMRERLVATGYDDRQTRIPLDLCVHYMANTALAMITWWLDHDFPYSAEQMATWLPKLNMFGFNYALGLDRPLPTGESSAVQAAAADRGTR